MKRLALIAGVLAAACGSETSRRSTTTSRSGSFEITLPATVNAGEEVSVGLTALNAAGTVDAVYHGTVVLSSDDADAVLPSAITFTAADQGRKTVAITFQTAGTHTVFASDRDGDRDGFGDFDVKSGKAVAFDIDLPATTVAGNVLIGQVSALDKNGRVVKSFDGRVHFTSTDSNATLPADVPFTSSDRGQLNLGFRLVTAGPQTVTVTQVGGSATGRENLTVKPAGASRISLDLAASVTVDTNLPVAVTVRDAFANVATGYTGRVHFVLTDAAGRAPADVTFTAAMAGRADVIAQFGTAGDQSILAMDTANPSIAGSAETLVNAGRAATYSLSRLPSAALAGEPLALTITAVDAHGNVAADYGGSASVTSTDHSDLLPATGGFGNGVRNVALAFVSAGNHFATVNEVGGIIHVNTSSVSIVAADAVALLVSGGSATAGSPAATTVTAKDTFGNTAASYAGTVSFSSSDATATLPTSFTFTSADAGQRTFSLTFRQAGSQTLSVSDGRAAGSGSFTVSAGAGAACSLLDLPGTAGAGAEVGFLVVVRDAFGNIASGYTGTISISSTDAAAQIGAPGAYTPTDAGSRAFAIQLRTAGLQTVTARDATVASLSCGASTTVVPGATVLVVMFNNSDAWAGSPSDATVTAQDSFANRVPTYAGTVAFTSSDAAANRPANVSFGAADDGQKTVSVTFNTIGGQTLTATDTVVPATTGTGTTNVHGLLYTNPPSGGRLRLVANASSNFSVVQLDLVSNTSLFPLTLGTNDTVRNGVFAAGMNLPLDTTKVGPDATLLRTTVPATVPASTAVLALGNAPQAVGAAISNGVLYSGISQKRVDTTAGAGSNNRRGDVAVRPFPGAASFYYSVRLKLTPGAAPGTVFDGQALASSFRAAVRDRSGTDVFAGPDFAIGKLEIR